MVEKYQKTIRTCVILMLNVTVTIFDFISIFDIHLRPINLPSKWD